VMTGLARIVLLMFMSHKNVQTVSTFSSRKSCISYVQNKLTDSERG
jgi:hypothetical protein